MTETAIEMDGITHLHGNLYRVKTSLIRFADKEDDKGDTLKFFNPRHVLSSKPKGFSKQEMSELREAIRTEGLENPLSTRLVEENGEKYLQLIGGERRKRSIDKLVKENLDCFNPATGEWVPATEMYEYVDCRINVIPDDKKAYKLAFSQNDKSIGIGEAASVALVGLFRNKNWNDDEILEATGKSVSWLRDTDFLLGLDEVSFKAFSDEEINRSAALQLLKISDIQERLNVLNSAKDFALSRVKIIKEKLEKDVFNANAKAEVAEATAVYAESQGDEETKTAAEEKAAKNRARAEKKKAEAEEIEAAAPKITSRDVHNAKISKKTTENNDSESNDDSDGKALTNAKMSKFWLGPITNVLETGGLDEDGEELGIDLDDVMLVKILLEARDRGDRNIVSILQDHFVNKGTYDFDSYLKITETSDETTLEVNEADKEPESE